MIQCLNVSAPLNWGETGACPAFVSKPIRQVTIMPDQFTISQDFGVFELPGCPAKGIAFMQDPLHSRETDRAVYIVPSR